MGGRWIRGNLYLPQPACAGSTNPGFLLRLQTLIHHELIMVLRVNQAWGGGGGRI